MHISKSTLITLLAYSSSATAKPTPNNGKDAASILRGPLVGIAKAFCSAYLHYPRTSIVYTTVTKTDLPGTTSYTTIPGQTSSQTISTTSTVFTTITESVYQPDSSVSTSVTVTGPTATVYQKRSGYIVAIPSQLKSCLSQDISSACSRIASPRTTTVTSQIVQHASGPVVTSTVTGQTVATTVTQQALITSTIETTATYPATTTVTYTVSTTVTPILVKPKICNARGLPGSNAFNYDANFNTNQADCIASCKTDSRCLSTGYYLVTDPSTGSATGTCRKYDKSVTDSADLGFGYYNLNDKAC